MDETQGSRGWCATCGGVRDFAAVPDTGGSEYACVTCGAAMLVPSADDYVTVA